MSNVQLIVMYIKAPASNKLLSMQLKSVKMTYSQVII